MTLNQFSTLVQSGGARARDYVVKTLFLGRVFAAVHAESVGLRPDVSPSDLMNELAEAERMADEMLGGPA